MSESRVVLITGASRGIGKELAFCAAREGYHVAINFLRGANEAEGLVQQIAKSGGRAVAIGADVSVATDVDRLLQETLSQLGRLDCVINNAGQGHPTTLENLRAEDFKQTLTTNLLSAFLVSQAAIPHMKEHGGRLIFMSSGAARNGGKISAAYAASKAGLEGLMRYYATYLLPWRITANALAPALIESEMVKQMRLPPPEELPLGRLGRPEELWPAVRMFLETEYITGQTVHVDAGRYMT